VTKHPWRLFLAALAGTALVAAGFALTVDGVLAGGQPAPQLRSVPPVTLARTGLTLGPATQPPYCGVAQQAARNGWVRDGFGGCAISQDAAERAAAPGSSQVVESLLARVTTSDRQPALHDRLAWLVAVRGGPVLMPAILCSRRAVVAGTAATGSVPTGPAGPCGPPMPAPTRFLRVMVLDGTTGQILTSVSPGVVQFRPGAGAAPFGPPPRALPTAPAVRATPLLVPPQGT
jgi:hypothetical protein